MYRLLVSSALCLLGLFAHIQAASAQQSSLTVEKIMQDPEKWVGGWPTDVAWSEDGRTVYFEWNPKGQFTSDSLYKVARSGGEPIKVGPDERRQPRPLFTGWYHGEHVYDAGFSRKVFAEDGDLYLYHRDTDEVVGLTRTPAEEADPRFSRDSRRIIFRRENNLFRLHPGTGLLEQITDLRAGAERDEQKPDSQQAFLGEQQEELFEIIRQRKQEREEREAAVERDEAARDLPPTYYYGDDGIQQLKIDPAERFVTFVRSNEPTTKATQVQNYVTESGYAENIETRPKVGVAGAVQTLYVQDLELDTTYAVDLHQISGAYDVPEYLREQGERVDSAKAKRTLYPYGPYWSSDGRYAVLEIRAGDNKDRWIVRLHPETADLDVLDRQRDEAWVSGPGTGWGVLQDAWDGMESTRGWLPDGRRFFFQSERTGYSHLYTVDVETGDIRQLTSGEFEVFEPRLSQDGRWWYFTSSEGSPYERHFYRMPVEGGARERLTTMPGKNEVALSPDGERMAVLYSYTNRPPEVYLQAPNGEPERITYSPTDEWLSYAWRDPEIVTFEASDGVRVPAQVFVPENPNGAAVLFVHGAGYLQNVHTWWSQYYREYMFHNLLADLGYVVMNVDYRASEGYGRDWRTAIYRHMGGRDLQDQVDASQYLTRTHGIDPERVFIYGGSYGGFITLMALFTEPEHFGGGAALRSVTDWAHYNDVYTSAILNTPATDSLAYVRSSPIYFAEGLEDPLLIAHGMVDTNVHFQDVVRLAQRLIELGKEDWEMAVYPVEDHGFTEPSSWTDEYRRILEYVARSVGPQRGYFEEPVLGGASGR